MRLIIIIIMMILRLIMIFHNNHNHNHESNSNDNKNKMKTTILLMIIITAITITMMISDSSAATLPATGSSWRRPIAEQIRGPWRDKTTTKQNKPTPLKKLKTRRARDCAGVCEAPRGLCEFRCRGMMHHDGSSLKLLAMPLGIGVAWAQRDGIRAPLVAFNVASAGLSRFGPPDTGDDNTNNDNT